MLGFLGIMGVPLFGSRIIANLAFELPLGGSLNPLPRTSSLKDATVLCLYKVCLGYLLD